MANKRELLPVAYYRELGYDDVPMVLRLSDSRDRRQRAHKAEVVAYLKSGPLMVYAMSRGRDAFDPSKEVDRSTVTDGRYEWERGLSDYVDRYDILLTPAFEAHMRANGWRIPDGVDTRSLAIRAFVEPSADDLASFASDSAAAGRVAEAEAAYRTVIGSVPAHRASLDGLTTILRAQERTSDLVEVLSEAIANTPGDGSLWFRRGTLLEDAARRHAATRGGVDAVAQHERAMNDLRRAVSLGHEQAKAALQEAAHSADGGGKEGTP